MQKLVIPAGADDGIGPEGPEGPEGPMGPMGPEGPEGSEKLREMIRAEVAKNCADKRYSGGCKSGGMAAWFGRLLRGFTVVTVCAGLLAAGGCRTICVEVENSNASRWKVSATAFIWESQIDSLTVDGVGIVSGYKGKTDESAIRAAAEAGAYLTAKGLFKGGL